MNKEFDQKSFEKAFNVIKQAMMDDEPSKPGSIAHGWHCNIAMACYDAMLQTEGDGHEHHKIANNAASRFMKLCFDVETKR